MIILDTNVLSALMHRDPDLVVVSWLDRQAPESVWTTSVTVFEILFGIELLVTGRRRQQLEEAFKSAIEEDFSGRILPFEQAAAREAALLAAQRQREGMPVEIRDTLIAGIALARRATLATRNVKHFSGTGIELVNPWEPVAEN